MLIALTALLSACSSTSAGIVKETPVTTQPVSIGRLSDENIFTGVLEADSETVISSESSGVITDLSFEVGSRIPENANLAKINTDTLNVQINGVIEQLKTLDNHAKAIAALYDQQIKNAKQNFQNTVNVSNQSLNTVQTQLRDSKYLSMTDARIMGELSFNTVRRQLLDANWNLDQQIESSFSKNDDTFNAGSSTGYDLESSEDEGTTESPDNSSAPAAQPVDFSSAISSSYSQIGQLESQLEQTRAQGISNENKAIMNIHNLESQLAQVRAETKSKIDQQHQSVETLIKQKNMSLAEIENTATQLKSQLSSLHLNHDKANIISSQSGVITEKFVEIGQLVQPGTPIAKIANTDKFKIKFDIPVKSLNKLPENGELSITLDGMDNVYLAADITKINPKANANSKKITIEATLRSNSEPFLISGLYAKIYYSSHPEKGLIVPSKSIVSRYGQTYVFIDKENIAKKKLVKVIKKNENNAIISGDLTPQDKVITKGHQWLRDGDSLISQ